MEDKEREQKLDQWLNQALSDYNSAEPRFGLEQRVLNRLQAEARPRRWNFWRWMPAFAAIAAAVIIAVAIRPLTVRNEAAPKTTTTSDQIQTYLQPSTIPSGADHDKLSSSKSSSETSQVPANGKSNGRALLSLDLKQSTTSASSPSALQKSPDARNRERSKSLNAGSNGVINSGLSQDEAFASAPAPPPPPLSTGIAVGGLLDQTSPAPTVQGRSFRQLESRQDSESAAKKAAEPVNIITTNGRVESENIVVETLPQLAPVSRDRIPQAKRKEAHATPPADTSFDAFGVTVRTDKIANAPIGPSHQFPTPAPLSQQERLAVVAGEKLKDKAVTKDTSGTIPRIEIKEVEIAPLEAPKE